MRRYNHRGLRVIIGNNRVQNIFACYGIHARDRFVKQIESRPSCHDQHKLHLFLRSLGKRFEPRILIHAKLRQHTARRIFVKILIEILKEFQNIGNSHPIVEIGSLRQKRNHSLGLHAADPDFAFGRPKQPRCKLQKRCFSAPV